MAKISDIVRARASETVRKLNPQLFKPYAETNDKQLPTINQECTERGALVSPTPRKAKSGVRFEIVFTVYAVSPADWDGYHVKELQDLLVKSGILPGDDWATLQGKVVPQKAAKKEEEKTVIEITQIN